VRPRLESSVRTRVHTVFIELTELATRTPPTFGEFLVQHDVLDRVQLFRALQLQDRRPGLPLGQCAVALGYAPRESIEAHHARFAEAVGAELEAMSTEAFDRDWPVEIVADGR
jgi:hypothetical protein